MDPLAALTAALQATAAVVNLATKIWDATSDDLKKKEADNLAMIAINSGNFVVMAQGKINALLQPK